MTQEGSRAACPRDITGAKHARARRGTGIQGTRRSVKVLLNYLLKCEKRMNNMLLRLPPCNNPAGQAYETTEVDDDASSILS